MYQITVKTNGVEEILHETSTKSLRRVTACTFSEEVGMTASATFSVLPQNPVYESLQELATTVCIHNTLTGEAEFEGRILQKAKDAMEADGSLGREFICEGCMGYLNDTRQMYFHYQDTENATFIAALLDAHNAHVTEERKIYPGICEISGTSSKTTVYRTTLEELNENLITRHGGELRVRRDSDGKLRLDYLNAGSGKHLPTAVILGDNLVSVTHSTDATNIITRLIPLGAQLNDETAERLTLKGYFPDDPERYWLDDEAAIAKYGIIEGTAEFDDITLQNNLFDRGTEFQKNNNRIRHSYQAEVLDLSTIGKAADAFRAGNYYLFKNQLIGLQEELQILKRTVDIYKPYKPKIEIGEKTERITDLQVRTARLIEYDLPQQKIDILASARQNATNALNSATPGHIVIDKAKGEILIMDTPDIATAQKIWRWNSSGWGYTNEGYSGTYKLAATLDGGFVADFITAGVIRGLEILNGDGTFHVYPDGTAEAKNLKITGGSINIQTDDQNYDMIDLTSGVCQSQMTPMQFYIRNSGVAEGTAEITIQGGAILFSVNGQEKARINTGGDAYFTNVFANGNSISNSIVGNSNSIELLINDISEIRGSINSLNNRVTALGG